MAVWLGGGGAAGRQPAGTDLLPVPWSGQVAFQLQHHTTAPASCQPAPLVLACDGTLHVSGLQKDLGLGLQLLLPPHLPPAGWCLPVASAAQLLDAHLRISGSTAPSPAAAAPSHAAMLPVSLEPLHRAAPRGL